MNNLRNALGRTEESEEVSLSRLGPTRLYNKSKSMWALEEELEEGGRERGQAEARLRANFQSLVESTFKADPNFSEVVPSPSRCASTKSSTSFRPNRRACWSWSACWWWSRLRAPWPPTPTTACEVLRVGIRVFGWGVGVPGAADPQAAQVVVDSERKEKKNELQEYDKIVQNNFRRKGNPQFIDEDNDPAPRPKPRHNPRANDPSPSQPHPRRNASSSTEGRLAQLLSNPRNSNDNSNTHNGEEEPEKAEESVSFASVVSQSMAVRQRRPKEEKKKKEVVVVKEDSENKDEAFIFYRPKAAKK